MSNTLAIIHSGARRADAKGFCALTASRGACSHSPDAPMVGEIGDIGTRLRRPRW